MSGVGCLSSCTTQLEDLNSLQMEGKEIQSACGKRGSKLEVADGSRWLQLLTSEQLLTPATAPSPSGVPWSNDVFHIWA